MLMISGCGGDHTNSPADDADVTGDSGALDVGTNPGPDAAADAVVVDAEVDGGPDAAPPVCALSDHAGCASDQLCCEVGGVPACVSTSMSECAACGTACDTDAADSCVDRACRCGTEASCTGATPLCDATPGVCVECLSLSDCTDELCVDGSCLECDPADNTGCAGDTPICDAATTICRACQNDSECTAPGAMVCADAGVNLGACVECDAGNDTACTGSLPACDVTSNQCVECTSSWLHCGGTTPICDMMVCRACAGDDECALINPGWSCGGSGACG